MVQVQAKTCIYFNLKLVFSYILNLFVFNFLNLQFYIKYKNTLSLLVMQKYSLYLFLHIKLSTFFFNLRLLDIFGYEVFSSTSGTSDAVVYLFNSPNSNSYVFFFILQSVDSTNAASHVLSNSKTYSCTEFFYNASWLEREVSELSGILFTFKKDTRNLMLQFGDFSYPFKKKYPSIGFREFFYNGLTDKILYKPVSVQF